MQPNASYASSSPWVQLVMWSKVRKGGKALSEMIREKEYVQESRDQGRKAFLMKDGGDEGWSPGGCEAVDKTHAYLSSAQGNASHTEVATVFWRSS